MQTTKYNEIIDLTDDEKLKEDFELFRKAQEFQAEIREGMDYLYDICAVH